MTDPTFRRQPDATRRALTFSTLGLLGLGGVAGLAGCGGGDALDDPRVRFVNGLLDVPSADFLVDGQRAQAAIASGGNGTNYVFLNKGSRRIAVRAASATANLTEAGYGFGEKVDHSVVAYGTAAAPRLRQFVENSSAPASGQVKVRALHAASAVAGLNLYLTTNNPVDLSLIAPTLQLPAYDTLTDFRSLPAGTYTLLLALAGTNTSVFARSQVTITAGTVVTLVVVPRGGLALAVTSLPESATGSVLTP